MHDPRTKISVDARLAAAREPEEVAQILGKPRLWRYAFTFAGLAVAFAVYAIYMVVEVVRGRRNGWSLAALGAPVSLTVFFGVIAVASFHFCVTGRRVAWADAVGRVSARLNSDLWPSRRRRPRGWQ